MSLIPATFRPFRLALIQLATTADKAANLRRARTLVKEASTKGANVIVLPVSTHEISEPLVNECLSSGMFQQPSNSLYSIFELTSLVRYPIL
jgi:hypothetical protein